MAERLPALVLGDLYRDEVCMDAHPDPDMIYVGLNAAREIFGADLSSDGEGILSPEWNLAQCHDWRLYHSNETGQWHCLQINLFGDV